MPRVVEWTEPPQMDTGAPMPALEQSDDAVVVAYICRGDHSAVVGFSGVSWLHFGYPNDEGLSEHPLYEHGLKHYAFWEVLGSPRVSSGASQRHWIATFHDETLEVVATSATVVAREVPGTATNEIARQYA